MVLWHFFRLRKKYPSLRLPITAGLVAHSKPFRGMLKQNLFILRVLSLIFLIFALARPQTSFNEENVNTEGIDIMLALDISGSMKALDFKPDRLGAAKLTASNFIKNRKNDRMGLVVFASESFTQCPLTTDHQMLQSLLRDIDEGLLESGTAIGMGLSTAVIRLKDSDAKSRVVILLTDGDNNSGFIDPVTATEAAKQFGIRVYTIGVGKNGMAPYRVKGPFGNYQIIQQEVKLDEKLLEQIANSTGGKYYNVKNNKALDAVYEEIDQLEKTRIQVTRITRKTERFYWFLIIGGMLLLLEWILRYAVVRSIP
ncbi:MAG: VWA domain-containing protein [Bacteroidia bacterium]|nr:VWA domain-containing protein [Bacteroidia bacterium]